MRRRLPYGAPANVAARNAAALDELAGRLSAEAAAVAGDALRVLIAVAEGMLPADIKPGDVARLQALEQAGWVRRETAGWTSAPPAALARRLRALRGA